MNNYYKKYLKYKNKYFAFKNQIGGVNKFYNNHGNYYFTNYPKNKDGFILFKIQFGDLSLKDYLLFSLDIRSHTDDRSRSIKDIIISKFRSYNLETTNKITEKEFVDDMDIYIYIKQDNSLLTYFINFKDGGTFYLSGEREYSWKKTPITDELIQLARNVTEANIKVENFKKEMAIAAIRDEDEDEDEDKYEYKNRDNAIKDVEIAERIMRLLLDLLVAKEVYNKELAKTHSTTPEYMKALKDYEVTNREHSYAIRNHSLMVLIKDVMVAKTLVAEIRNEKTRIENYKRENPIEYNTPHIDAIKKNVMFLTMDENVEEKMDIKLFELILAIKECIKFSKKIDHIRTTEFEQDLEKTKILHEDAIKNRSATKIWLDFYKKKLIG